MSWNWNYRPYVSVATRRKEAERHAKKLAKSGEKLFPVTIDGRMIARTFWGKAWCKHLESFSDYENRLPRGRTYVRNGSVLHLGITAGKITTRVMGSSLYLGTIAVTPLKPERWKAIKQECAGKIDSLVGLLQGRLSDAVMRVITDRENGLFPKPTEIKMECSCPDWADLCKHLAAVLYGVGARLDTQPELLFLLRGVDHLELIEAAAEASALGRSEGGAAPLDSAELSDVFGIEIEPSGGPVAMSSTPSSAAPAKPKNAVGEGKIKKPARRAADPIVPRAAKTTPKPKTALAGVQKKRSDLKRKPKR